MQCLRRLTEHIDLNDLTSLMQTSTVVYNAILKAEYLSVRVTTQAQLQSLGRILKKFHCLQHLHLKIFIQSKPNRFDHPDLTQLSKLSLTLEEGCAISWMFLVGFVSRKCQIDLKFKWGITIDTTPELFSDTISDVCSQLTHISSSAHFSSCLIWSATDGKILSSLTSLHLYTPVQNPESYDELSARLPVLESLYLTCEELNGGEFFSSFPQLRNLALVTNSRFSIDRITNCPPLKSFDISSFAITDAELVELLVAMSPTLESLKLQQLSKISLLPFPRETRFPFLKNLSCIYCPKLRDEALWDLMDRAPVTHLTLKSCRTIRKPAPHPTPLHCLSITNLNLTDDALIPLLSDSLYSLSLTDIQGPVRMPVDLPLTNVKILGLAGTKHMPGPDLISIISACETAIGVFLGPDIDLGRVPPSETPTHLGCHVLSIKYPREHNEMSFNTLMSMFPNLYVLKLAGLALEATRFLEDLPFIYSNLNWISVTDCAQQNETISTIIKNKCLNLEVTESFVYNSPGPLAASLRPQPKILSPNIDDSSNRAVKVSKRKSKKCVIL